MAADTLESVKTRPETILLYGKAKVGKTMAACSVIDEAVKADPNVTVFYICTDNGIDTLLHFYFGEKADEIFKRNIKEYRVFEFKKNPAIPLFTQVSTVLFEIAKTAKPTDWIIVDLADKFWNWAQDEWLLQSALQNAPTSYISDAAKDIKKFMEFNRSQWQFIKRLDNIATTDVIENPPCNLLYVFGEKAVELEDDSKTKEEEKKTNDIFDLVGSKPAGQGSLPYAFSTIVYISGLRDKKFFILGDRGYPANYVERPFGRNWYAAFTAIRKKEG